MDKSDPSYEIGVAKFKNKVFSLRTFFNRFYPKSEVGKVYERERIEVDLKLHPRGRGVTKRSKNCMHPKF